VGGICAGLLSPLVDGSYSRKLRLFGWHPSEPRESAKAIAASTALATGAPLVANAIVPKPKAPPQGAQPTECSWASFLLISTQPRAWSVPTPARTLAGMRDIVAAACTFGNSFTLPCVFFASLLPPDLFHRAIGYAGLFLLAWSPCLWTVGLRLVSRQETALAPGASSGQEDEGGANRMLAALTAAKGFLAAVINPPLAGCLAGLAVGLSPLGQSLLANSGPALAAAAGAADALPAAAGASFLPLELRLLRGAVQAVLDVIRLLADGTLATQVVVLAAALLQRPEESVPADEPTVRQTPTSTVAGNTGMFAALLGAILPSDSAEARALVVVAVSRHILVPLSTLAVLHVLSKTVLSRMAVDPVLLFVLLVQAVSPLPAADVAHRGVPILAPVLCAWHPRQLSYAPNRTHVCAEAVLPPLRTHSPSHRRSCPLLRTWWSCCSYRRQPDASPLPSHECC
jgi:hypothetical protein